MENKEEIKELIEKLRRYCHDKNCNNWGSCPGMHPICRNRLGFNTAIAWKVSEYLNIYLCTTNIEYQKKIKYKIITISNIFYGREVLTHHYLYNMIMEAIRLL